MNDMESPRPRLYVVRVLNARELVVSGGSEACLYEDQLLRVLGNSEELIDPVTEESLGHLKTTKALVRVYEVAPKFALARTFRTRRVNVGGRGYRKGPFADIFEAPKFETRTETLVRDTSFDIKGETSVAAGDPVEQWDGEADDVPSMSVWA